MRKSRKKSVSFCLGRRCRRFESCHSDQKGRGWFAILFLFALKLYIEPSAPKETEGLRLANLRCRQIYRKPGSESYHSYYAKQSVCFFRQ